MFNSEFLIDLSVINSHVNPIITYCNIIIHYYYDYRQRKQVPTQIMHNEQTY